MPTSCLADFAALADPTREQIVRPLLQGKKSVGEIVERLPVSRPAVSKHLRLLEDAGLLTFRSLATRNLHSVDPGALQSLHDELNRVRDQALARCAWVANNCGSGASSLGKRRSLQSRSEFSDAGPAAGIRTLHARRPSGCGARQLRKLPATPSAAYRRNR